MNELNGARTSHTTIQKSGAYLFMAGGRIMMELISVFDQKNYYYYK